MSTAGTGHTVIHQLLPQHLVCACVHVCARALGAGDAAGSKASPCTPELTFQQGRQTRKNTITSGEDCEEIKQGNGQRIRAWGGRGGRQEQGRFPIPSGTS